MQLKILQIIPAALGIEAVYSLPPGAPYDEQAVSRSFTAKPVHALALVEQPDGSTYITGVIIGDGGRFELVEHHPSLLTDKPHFLCYDQPSPETKSRDPQDTAQLHKAATEQREHHKKFSLQDH